MASSSSSSSRSIGFVGLLQILFIGLKLTHYISWPWWQVLLPTIISASVAAALVLFLVMLAIISRIGRSR